MHRRVLRPARAPKGLSCLTTDGSPALRKCTIIHEFRKNLLHHVGDDFFQAEKR